VTGDDVLCLLQDARVDGDYVLITPDGQIFSGPIVAVAQVGMRLALLEQLPTEGTMQ
jgi:SOS-response transcriptional repressor LexA